ncbi:MAG: CPBP family intramembrane metalloprotease [Candidatus Cloacimonetes bacterium]|nr:CPBP family intramembrane metalloprotease [Candidatus Cloacimonadota bacterium]
MGVLKIDNIVFFTKKHPYLVSLFITITLLFILFLAGMISVVEKIDSKFTFFVGFFITSLILIIFITKNKKWEYYGFNSLSKSNINMKKTYIFIPLYVLAIMPLGTGIIQNLVIEDIIYIITYMILVAFVEETIFRGLILQLLSKKGLLPAIFGSSILFSIAHLMNTLRGNNLESTIIQILYALIIGIILAILVIRTKNIFFPIIYHYINNLVSSFNINAEMNLSLIINYSMFFIASIYAIYLYYLMMKNIENENIKVIR